ncbi:hypothetical protein C5167_026421 [Papaver somniferum]|nr:hypothetical protein C5167_026421 [Papaver somniferum]
MEEVDVETRGSIAFFSRYRPPVPLDIFSCPIPPTSSRDEHHMTDGKSYNYSGTEIPPEALMKIFTYTSLTGYGSQADVDSGRITGIIFVSERKNLEVLHIALRHNDVNPPRVKIHSLGEVLNRLHAKYPFEDGVRLEDSGCFAGDYLIYVSTKERATERRQPWTAVYKTNLTTGKTDRLTPREDSCGLFHTSKGDHFNPFVIGGGKRIGYHCCTSDPLDDEEEIKRQFQIITSPIPDIGLFRVGGGFPTFSKNGSRLVDNDFKIVWYLTKKTYMKLTRYQKDYEIIFSPVWNQNDRLDTLYVCLGPSFSPDAAVEIYAIRKVSAGKRQLQPLTDGGFNNAFPSSSPDGNHQKKHLSKTVTGKRIVYRSTRDGSKNLYTMDDAKGAVKGVAPKSWIVFSSNRDKPPGTPEKDHGLDSGYFAVYLVNPNDPTVVVRVISSGNDLGGHVNHPFFSPDGLSIVVTSDLAAVSVDPISLPIFVHSARPYGDIFSVDIDPDDIQKNEDLKMYNRLTHSRYENSTGTWTGSSPGATRAARKLLQRVDFKKAVPCPYAGGDESWQMTGHLVVPNGCN